MGNFGFNVGDRVSHPTFGKGTVQKIIKGCAAEVLFDEVYQGKQERILRFDFLTSLDSDDNPIKTEINESQEPRQKSEKKPLNLEKFKKGDFVFHDKLGTGTYVEKSGFFWCYVRFNKTGEVKKVLEEQLQHKEFSMIDDDEIGLNDSDNSFKIIPGNYQEHACYTEDTKRFLTYLKKHYRDKGIATVKADVQDGVRFGVLAVPDKGIVVFGLIETEYSAEVLQQPLFEAIALNGFEKNKKYFIDKFYQSKKFCNFYSNNTKVLKYPIRFIYVLQNVDIKKLRADERNRISIKNKDVYFRNLTSMSLEDELFSRFENYDAESFESFEGDMFGSIVERIVPENATIIDVGEASKTSVITTLGYNPEFRTITGNEMYFSALHLDDSQIKTINDTKPGHYLTLANPGTGKSVLLVSKAFRIQSKQKDNHVLITCYNHNLAEHHETFAKISGLYSPYMHIKTIYKFAWDQVEKYDPSFTSGHSDSDTNFFDELMLRFESLIVNGTIKTKLNAIFIDEVQLFQKKWIDLCYMLLDRQGGKDSFFEMFGDINQDIRTQQSKGKASWQGLKVVPALTGRVRKLETNYRNTKTIASYLKNMVNDMNQFLEKNNVEIDRDVSSLDSKASREGTLRIKVYHIGECDMDRVAQSVEELRTKMGADYNDIAVVFPARKYRDRYPLLERLHYAFEKRDIPYGMLVGDFRKSLYEIDGVALSTIDSCLGLDFKYVILCGLRYWDFDFKREFHKDFTRFNARQTDETVLKTGELWKKVYSACSRARDGLIIVDDTTNESKVQDMIKPVKGKELYDVF